MRETPATTRTISDNSSCAMSRLLDIDKLRETIDMAFAPTGGRMRTTCRHSRPRGRVAWAGSASDVAGAPDERCLRNGDDAP